MADCPSCGSRAWRRRKFPHLFKWEMGCDFCGWRMDADKVNEQGGLMKVAMRNLEREEEPTDNGSEEKSDGDEWEQIDRLPDWAFKKMKFKHSNIVNGEHYQYKRDGDKFFKRLK